MIRLLASLALISAGSLSLGSLPNTSSHLPAARLLTQGLPSSQLEVPSLELSALGAQADLLPSTLSLAKSLLRNLENLALDLRGLEGLHLSSTPSLLA